MNLKSSLFFLFKRKRKFYSRFSQNCIADIIHKVRYNIPDIQDCNFSFKEITNAGLVLDRPFYIEEFKNINLNYAKSLFLANKIAKFYLIIFYSEKDDISIIKCHLPNAKFLVKNYISKRLKESFYALNINQKNKLNYSLSTTNSIFINNKKLENFYYKNYGLYNMETSINFFGTYYKGVYYNFKNILKNNKKINILIKKLLFINNFNYFYIFFNKNKLILTDLNNYKQYIIFNKKYIFLKLIRCKYVDAYELTLGFSCDDFINLYFGNEEINILGDYLNDFVINIAKNNFLTKINSKNNKMNYYYNNYLPKQIIIQQVMGRNVSKFDALRKYISIKNNLYCVSKDTIYFKNSLLKDFSLNLIYKEKNKTINFYNSDLKKIFVDGVEYVNCNALSLKLFDQFDNFDVYG